MNFVSQSLIELARGNRLFLGAVDANTPIVDHELASASFVYTKLAPSEIAECLRATPWVSGRSYSRIGGDIADSLVVNSAHQVFICMHAPANGGATSEPVRTEAMEVEGADGYVWRYLFAVPSSALEKFGWSGLIPVQPMSPPPVTVFTIDTLSDLTIAAPRLSVYPAANHVKPRAVVENGELATIIVPYGKIAANRRVWVKVEEAVTTGEGAILSIQFQAGVMSATVVAGGTGYSTDAIATVVGNGTGARVAITVSSGSVIAAQVIAQGSGYTWAEAIVTDGASSGVAHPMNLDYETQLGRIYTVISKSVPILDEASTAPLDVHFFLAETPEPAVRVRGAKGSMLVGVETQTRFHFLSECKPASFRLDQEMLINTVITSG